jgi:NAD(P)-dependent dehydrogenase (short-subunit alcohol dehydrogenase family)
MIDHPAGPAARPGRSGVDLRKVPWRVGLELDPLRQLRRARRTLAGRSERDALAAAVAGKRIVVTGASAGIGRLVARRLARVGAEVIVVARREELLDQLVSEIVERGGTAEAWPCDLAELDQVDALAAALLDRFDTVDVLINNAGRSIRRSLTKSTDRLHDFHRVMGLNYFGAVHLTLPLIARMADRGGGHVVNVSTMATQLGPEPRFAAYVASKAALDAFARSAAPETFHRHVTWTTVHLPLVRTEMIAPSAVYRRLPAMSVSDGANMVLDAVVRRPTRVTHPLGVTAHLVDLAMPSVFQQIMGLGARPRRHRPAG